MGTLDSLRAAYGDDFDGGGRAPTGRHTWEQICTCGHLLKYHSQSTGGSYQTVNGETQFRGETVKLATEFGGCIGAMPTRGQETETKRMDREAMVLTTVLHPTCPCTEARPIVNVDRPNRFFNQRVLDRHPFLVGIGAFAKHLSKRKAALEDPEWATAEFDRRFTWIDGSRICSMSRCTTSDETVLPVYVNDARHSELRCARHRE
jgi:hypothetical protein